jgi:hypothetical protein
MFCEGPRHALCCSKHGKPVRVNRNHRTISSRVPAQYGGCMYDEANELLKTLGTAAISMALGALLFGFLLSFRG